MKKHEQPTAPLRQKLALRRTPRPEDRLIGARLRHLRTTAGISQSDLGQAIGVTFQQVQKYENGVNRVSGSAMISICRRLKCAPNVLLLGSIKGNGHGPTEDVLALLDDADVRRCLQALHRLPPGRRTAVAKALRMMIDAFVPPPLWKSRPNDHTT